MSIRSVLSLRHIMLLELEAFYLCYSKSFLTHHALVLLRTMCFRALILLLFHVLLVYEG